MANVTSNSVAILIGIVLFFTHSHAKAEEGYIPYGVTKYSVLYYNPESITYPSKGVIRLQTKVVSKCNDSKEWMIKDHPNCSNLDWAYVITFTEINCSSKQDRDISSVGYNKEGKPTNSLSTEDAEWDDIIPESYSEALYKLVCH
jgi:hypothetical protein